MSCHLGMNCLRGHVCYTTQTHKSSQTHTRTNEPANKGTTPALKTKKIGNRFSNNIFLSLKAQDHESKHRTVSLPFRRRAMPVNNTVRSNKASAQSASACTVIARIDHNLKSPRHRVRLQRWSKSTRENRRYTGGWRESERAH